MGTNYYLHAADCAPLHVGKSSAGWVFALRVHPDLEIHTYNDWLSVWANPKVDIRDQYGTSLSVDEMRRTIQERSWPQGDLHRPEILRRNSAEPGPNGLLRNPVRPGHCIGHGPGTWDLFECDFC